MIRPIALGFGVAFPLNAVCFNEGKTINWTINGFKSHWKPPIAVHLKQNRKQKAKWNEQPCTLLLWKNMDTRYTCVEKKKKTFCECTPKTTWKNAKIKQWKQQQVATVKFMILLAFTIDITTARKAETAAEITTTTNHHEPHSLTQCVFMVVFT